MPVAHVCATLDQLILNVMETRTSNSQDSHKLRGGAGLSTGYQNVLRPGSSNPTPSHPSPQKTGNRKLRASVQSNIVHSSQEVDTSHRPTGR